MTPRSRPARGGARTVEKIIRVIEKAYADGRPDGLPGGLGRAPGSPTRSRCFPGRRGRREDLPHPGPGIRARSRRCARCSARRRPAAPTSRRSATSSPWSRATPRCTWAARGMVEMVVRGGAPPWRRWAAPGCTAPCPAAGHHLAGTEQEALDAVRGLPVLPARQLAGSRRPPGRPRDPPPRRPCARWSRPASARAFDMARLRGAAASLTRAPCSRVHALWGARADVGLSPGWGGLARRGGWPTTRCSRAASCSWTRRTRRPGSSSCATHSACRCCSLADVARLHGRHGGGSARASSGHGRQDDQARWPRPRCPRFCVVRAPRA